MTNWKKGGFMAAVTLLCILFLAGCGKKYQTMEVPAMVEAQSGLPQHTEEETKKTAKETKPLETSIHQTDVTAETAPAFASVDETVYVTGDQVNLRKSPSVSADVVKTLNKGTELKRSGISESWSRVKYENQDCYISSKYISKDKPASQAAESEPAVTGNGSGKIIAIDPGHQSKGNPEKEPIGPGASEKKAKVASGTEGTSTKLPEYKLTLAVSLKLKEELINRGYQVYMVRETNDVNISNAERAQMANNSGADIFIRVHANSLNDKSVHGALTMCQTSKNPYNGKLYSKSSRLSRAVVDGLCNQTGFKNRGIQETDTMSGINWCTIPVTIVEMGFMSNAEEDKKMATDEYQNKIARGIADGIDAYYNGQN